MRLELSTCILLAALLGATGCGTSVERLDPGEVRDLSGTWNDTDSQLVSREMVQDALARDWLPRHMRIYDKPPVLLVGEVRNLSHEHIAVKTFVASIERELAASGKVQFVASRDERGEVRDERRDQDLHARTDTRKDMGRELGADYMLTGTINSILDSEQGQQIRYYQVDLTLISLADNRKVWFGQKKIKKDIRRGSLRL